MNSIDRVANHLATLQLRYDRLDDTHIGIAFSGQHLSYRALIFVNGPLVTLTAPRITSIPDARLTEVLRLANLLNATRIRLGAFWIDPDHDLGFELAILAPDEPTLEQVGFAMAALGVIDDFYPAFARVLWAGASAETAEASLREVPQEDLDEAV
jgi:hypothetical protein